MKNIIKFEELSLLTISFLVFLYLGFSWVIFFVFFLLPDISIAAYLSGNRTGAVIYNIFHHKTSAIILVVLGFILNIEFLIQLGIIFFAHSSFDRMLGLGLKYFDNFKHTHLSE